MSFSADFMVAKGDPNFSTAIRNLEGVDGDTDAAQLIDEAAQLLRQWLARGVLADGTSHDWEMTISRDDDGDIALTIKST